MPRRHNIRVKDKDIELAENLAKRIKKKKSNLYTRYRVRVDIEPKMPGDFRTRADWEKYQREAERFLNRNNPEYRYTRTEAGVTIRQDVLKEIEKLTKKVNKTKEKQFEKYKHLPFLIDKKPTDMTVAQYHDIVFNHSFEAFRMLKFNPNRFRTQHEAMEYLRELKKEFKGDWWNRQARNYKENYIKGLTKQFAGVPQLQQLINKVEKTSLKKLLELQYTTDEGKIKYMYEPQETMFLFEKVWEAFN